MFESLFGSLPLWFRVMAALADYMVKASSNWRNTPEGAQEWNDFSVLYEQFLNQEGGEAQNVTFGVEDREMGQSGQASQPAKQPTTTRRARGPVFDARDNA